jgi:hypothetical protein
MEAIYSSETSVATQQATRRHIPEDDTLHLFFYIGVYTRSLSKASLRVRPSYLA